MADFDGSKPVKTLRDNEFAVRLVDGASGSSATKLLSILAEGDSLTGSFAALVAFKDASGNAKIPEVNADGSLNTVITATDLDIRDLTHLSDSVKIGDGVEFLEINADGSLNAVVEATDFDIRDLTHVSDSVKVGDGTDFLAINTDGSVNAKTALPGSKVLDYKTSATVGAGSVTTHDYVVGNALTFIGKTVLVGAKGAVKVRVGTYDGTTFVPKFTYFQDPKENIDHDIANLELLGDGTDAIRIEITNTDGQSSDVYSTLMGYEA
jgi:hypothetical protein